MSKEQIFFRVQKGCLMPADSYAESRLRARNYHLNDLVTVVIKKLRNPRFNRLLHKIGCLVVENIESFCSYKAHDALKRLQIEANAGCQELKIWRHGKWELLRIPNSLSFESMDEGEYQEVSRKICHYLSNEYWPSMTPEAIEQLANQYEL